MPVVCRIIGADVMSRRIEERFLDACQRGKLPIIRELVEIDKVDINRVVDKRRGNIVWIGASYYYTSGWTSLHHASA